MLPYILAMSASFTFALGSQFFTYYSRTISVVWINTVKSIVGAIFFAALVFATSGFTTISILNFGVFFISGFLALGLGDIFLLKAFSSIGPGRTMLLFGFHPLVVGALSWVLLGQMMEWSKMIGIIFFIGCLIILSIENFKKTKRWDFSGILFALAGVLIDAGGVLITRFGFEMNENISSYEGNLYRCFGAISAYGIIRCFYNFDLVGNFTKLSLKSKNYVIFGALVGTGFSLALYVEAIKISSNLGALTAVSMSSVFFAAALECLIEKKPPSRYLIVASLFLIAGAKFIIF